eukprot:Nk52_evm13s2462 gene=Nk52_evmTU13s2462
MRRRGAPSESRLKNALDEDEFIKRRSQHISMDSNNEEFMSSVNSYGEDGYSKFRETCDDLKRERTNSGWFSRKSSTEPVSTTNINSADAPAPGTSGWWDAAGSVVGAVGTVVGTAGAVAGTVVSTAGTVAGSVAGAAGTAASSVATGAKSVVVGGPNGSQNASKEDDHGISGLPKNNPNCHKCNAQFSLMKLRYLCAACDYYFCYYCLPSKYKHRVPRKRITEPTAVCEDCFFKTCVQCCGGRCISFLSVSELKEFLTSRNINHVGCAEKMDLVCKINDWGKLEKLKRTSTPSAVPMAHIDGGLQYLSVKELREVLNNHGINHGDCIEKSELIDRLQSSLNSHQSEM